MQQLQIEIVQKLGTVLKCNFNKYEVATILDNTKNTLFKSSFLEGDFLVSSWTVYNFVTLV